MSLRRTIEELGPYPSLFLLALPIATVEPLKSARAIGSPVSDDRHLLRVQRLRRGAPLQPKLLAIPWFAKLCFGADASPAVL